MAKGIAKRPRAMAIQSSCIAVPHLLRTRVFLRRAGGTSSGWTKEVLSGPVPLAGFKRLFSRAALALALDVVFVDRVPLFEGDAGRVIFPPSSSSAGVVSVSPKRYRASATRM